jgi:hypothetical protein
MPCPDQQRSRIETSIQYSRCPPTEMETQLCQIPRPFESCPDTVEYLEWKNEGEVHIQVSETEFLSTDIRKHAI